MSKLDWNYVEFPMYFSMKLLWSITKFNWLLLDLYGGPKLGRIQKDRGREGEWFLPSITPSTYTHGQLIFVLFGDLPRQFLRKNGIVNCVSWIWIAKLQPSFTNRLKKFFFYLSLFAESQRGLEIAFKMLDKDGNGRLSKSEFFVVSEIFITFHSFFQLFLFFFIYL